jgi:hydrogenase maturation protein HypF
MFRQIIEDCQIKSDISVVSSKFHETMASIILELAKRYKNRCKINKVCLSGGVFQNKVLLNKAVNKLANDGFKVYFNNRVPVNDGGISLGQSWLALNGYERG